MMESYVYSHESPDGVVFYVGKGTGSRWVKTSNRSKEWRAAASHGFKARIIIDGLSEADAYAAERQVIASYKKLGHCVANVSLGGAGVNVPARWWHDKISASLAGRAGPRGNESNAWKDVDTSKIADMYTSGKSVSVISSLFGVSNVTVYSRLRDHGVHLADMSNGNGIVCVETGAVYKSVTAAARDLGLHREGIRSVLNGRYKSTGGKSFKRIIDV